MLGAIAEANNLFEKARLKIWKEVEKTNEEVRRQEELTKLELNNKLCKEAKEEII